MKGSFGHENGLHHDCDSSYDYKRVKSHQTVHSKLVDFYCM